MRFEFHLGQDAPPIFRRQPENTRFRHGLLACSTQTFVVPVVPAGVPAGTASSPLSNRLLAMTLSGVQVSAGDTLTIMATGMAAGGTGFLSFDANGAPAGSQGFSGPRSGAPFPTIV